MNSFLGLLKKDIKLSRMWLLVWICGIIFLLGTGHIIASRTKEPLVIFGFFVAVAFFSAFLISCFCFLSPSQGREITALAVQSKWRLMAVFF